MLPPASKIESFITGFLVGRGCSKVASKPAGAWKFSGFLPKAATVRWCSGGWQSAADFCDAAGVRRWRHSFPDFRAALLVGRLLPLCLS